VRVGHRQALILKTLAGILLGFFFVWRKVLTIPPLPLSFS
jgi:hypothetical protein